MDPGKLKLTEKGWCVGHVMGVRSALQTSPSSKPPAFDFESCIFWFFEFKWLLMASKIKQWTLHHPRMRWWLEKQHLFQQPLEGSNWQPEESAWRKDARLERCKSCIYGTCWWIHVPLPLRIGEPKRGPHCDIMDWAVLDSPFCLESEYWCSITHIKKSLFLY